MSIKALQDYTFTAKYANYKPEFGRRETWEEAVNRVKNMMLLKYHDKNIEEEINWAYDLVKQKKVLGSQRTMQFGGEPGLKHEMRNFNCQFSHVDRVSFFQEAMYLLMCGGGVGYSVQKHHIKRLPSLVSNRIGKKTFKPSDSIEGWADCIGVLLSSYFEYGNTFPEYRGFTVDFDLSNIRPEGSSIRGITGKAPGPEPLAKALKKIESILNECVINKSFEPINAHDIICTASDAVLAGGVRRSALLSLFSPDDYEMMQCKTGNWFYDNPQRARANNSVRLLRGEFSEKEYYEFFDCIKNFGEPGLSIADSRETGANPCVTGDTKIKVKIENVISDVEIASLVNKTVDVWNGFEWSRVFIKITGLNKKVLKISTSTNNYLKCTYYHNFILSDNTRVQAKDLKIGDVLLEGLDSTTNSGTVVEIQDIGVADFVYCFYEPKNNSGVFNNILTGQCHEILHFPYLVVDNDKYQKALSEGKIKYGFSCQPEEVGLKTGFQPCNLSTINCKKVKNEEDFLESCKAASIIGTLQAGLDSAPYLGEVTQEIIKREALLGVSMTGIMDNPDLILDPSLLKKGALECINTNSMLAPKININKAARICTIKPEGTTSCILGTSSGMHPHHYKRYIRRVQANRNEEIYKYFNSINPVACEKSVWSANDTDYVIAFACETSSNAKNKNDMSAIELLNVVKMLQEHWVNNGINNDLCVLPNTSHTVSNTINVKDDEWDDVAKFIFNNQEHFAGISLLSHNGDKDYPQAPFTAIYLPSQIAQEYGNGSLLASGLIERALNAFDNNLWIACDAAMGIGYDYDNTIDIFTNYLIQSKTLTDKHEEMQKIEKQLFFIKSFNKFANKYMDGDIKKTSYLLKDVYNWKIWSDLKREYKDVDFSLMREEKDNTNFGHDVACSGGACEIIYS